MSDTRSIDVIYVTSMPLTMGITAIVLKWLKRVPFIFEVRGQWPEIPIETISELMAREFLSRYFRRRKAGRRTVRLKTWKK